MKIESSNTEPPFLIIRDVYNENDLRKIKKEIDFIHSSGCLTSDNDVLQSAKVDGKYLKKASGVWMDRLYANRNTSTILKLNSILFLDEEIMKSFINLSPYYRSYGAINADTTLLHYYENEDSYGLHNGLASFEIGNENLVPEFAYNSDLAFKWKTDFVSIDFNLFKNTIKNFKIF
jgi:hypothetical protein